jgi:hypothetical protein
MAEVLCTSNCYSNSSRAHPAFPATMPIKTTLATHSAWPAIQIRIVSPF